MLERLPLLPAASAIFLSISLLSGQEGSFSQDHRVVDAPEYLLHALELKQGTMQELVLPVDGVPSFEITLIIDGVPRKLRLRRHDLRSAGYRLMVHDAAGIHEAESGSVMTYRGSVAGDLDSVVAATLRNDQIEAVIVLGDDTVWGIHPAHRADPDLPRSSHLIYAADELLDTDAICGVTAVAQPVTTIAPEAASPLKVVEIALDADRTYWRSNSSSIANTEADMMNVMNVVDAIYQRDVGIQYSITTMFVRTVQVYSQNNPGNLLNEFRQRWNTFHATLARDVTHLFFDKSVRGGTIGVAFPSAICNRPLAYGISATRFSTNLFRRAGLTAHELGHNWSAGHCLSTSNDCRIMCFSLGGCSGDTGRFGAASISSITNHKNTRSCLSNPEPLLGRVSPQAVTAFQAAEITLTGANFNAVTSIDIGGVAITDFTIESNSSIRFTPTVALPINFFGMISVSNSSGASNPLFLNVLGNHPSVLAADSTSSASNPLVIEAHTDRQWLVLLLASPSDVPSAFPGIIDLGIGDNFTRLRSVRSATSGDDGSHIFSLDLPPTLALPNVLHWQLVTLSGPSASLPLEVSNIVTITIL